MTCIATYFDPSTKTAAMAADGLLTCGNLGSTQHVGPAKIWPILDRSEKPIALIGMSGSMNFEQWWKRFNFADNYPQAKFREWTAEFFKDMRAEGHGHVDAGGTFTLDCTVIMVCADGIWIMNANRAFYKCGENYAAIGFGRDQAYGALYAASIIGSTPIEAATCAIGAASKHAAGCGPLANALVMSW